MVTKALKKFIKLEASGGIVLFIAALAAIIIENAGFRDWYEHLQHYPLGIGPVTLPLIEWVNDALMAVFFLIVGMEIKREVVEGELSSRARLIMPLVGALGGMVVPALLYVLCTRNNPEALRGWAIPTATDIAFAIGVVSLFGSRLPTPLKVFLTALAIIDDLGAILIIAFVYTANLNIFYLGISFVTLSVLVFLNIFGVKRLAPYLLIGILLWIFVFKSGIHATLAGVALALTIPLKGAGAGGQSPVEYLTGALHAWVTFLVLPIFSFLNAGVSLSGFGLETLLAPLPLGIALGLFVGKQLGVFTFSWIAIKLGWGEKPQEITWAQFYAVCVVTGIGFTMSLFIGGLAFKGPEEAALVRVGVICGSVLSTVLGAVLLYRSSPRAAEAA
ncbi:MAG: Na+/H+ antiporter NhaA [Deltaproteobacteria bacterium]|nr:Na+/H+ antiporter NhaA [Deltaproteobacteria bacterium]